MYDSLARYYDLIHEILTEDRTFIIDLAKNCGGPILELGCGTGRLLIPLAREGYKVTGIDNSSAMLAKAVKLINQESGEIQKRIELVEADIRNLSLYVEAGRFSLALFPYNTLLHFQSDEIRQLLRGLSRLLHSEGQIFIDITNPFIIDQVVDDIVPNLENIFTESDPNEVIRQWSQSQLISEEQRLHTSWTFEVMTGIDHVSKREVIEFDYYYYYPHQLEIILRESGYRLVQVLGDYDGTEFNEESERLILIANSST